MGVGPSLDTPAMTIPPAATSAGSVSIGGGSDAVNQAWVAVITA